MAILEKSTNNYYKIDFDECMIKGTAVIVAFSTYKTTEDREKEKARRPLLTEFLNNVQQKLTSLYNELISGCEALGKSAEEIVDSDGVILDIYPELKTKQAEMNALESMPQAVFERFCQYGDNLLPQIEYTVSKELLPYFWVPEDTLEQRVRRDHVPYDIWEKRGHIKTTEGNVVDYGFIEQFIDDLGGIYNIKEIAADMWNATHTIQRLEGRGFTTVPFRQGFVSMNSPTKELMRLVLEKKIAHGGHPALRWMMDNVYVKTDEAGNIKPDKSKSTERIDGAVALIMALDRTLKNEDSGSGKVYDGRDLLIL